MLYRIPNYYKEFECIADQCEDTCCAGWEIEVDKRSLAEYRKVSGEFGKRLRRSIDWRKGIFCRDRNERCTFLDNKNLCDIYKNLGAEHLCETCRMYPRHVEEFENVREITLSLSCPRVAQILLTRDEPVTFMNYEREGRECYGDFDHALYQKLVKTRETMRDILQDRTMELELRMVLVLGIAHDIQGRIKREELEACDEVLVRYGQKRTRASAARKLEKLRAEKSYKERMVSEQSGQDMSAREAEHQYEKTRRAFMEWMQRHNKRWDIQREQLLVYFMDTYFCGAVYDGAAYSKMQMAIGSVLLITEMLLERWCNNGYTLEEKDLVRTVYYFSRETEHSDGNIEMLEQDMRCVTLDTIVFL